MKNRFFGIIVLFVLLIHTLPSSAVPAYPFPIKITQPDGSELIIRLHGDEYFHYKTTVDGYALAPDKNGFLTYAQINSNGNLISSSFKARNIEKRSVTEKAFLQSLTRNPNLSKFSQIRRALRIKSQVSSSVPQKSYPLSGTPKSLVILVNFADVNFVTPDPKTSFTNLLNQSGYSTNGGTGSAKDYFHDASNGVFNPQFDVVGPFTLPNNMAFYGANDSSGSDTNPRQMVIDACTLAAASGVNFAQYDTDNNGIVDNIFVYYAGYNEAEGAPANTIWPHRWTLADLSTKFNGVSVYDYACTSELRGKSGSNMCGVGTFCHEFGHVLGLDDMYNTNNDYSYNTLSYWDIMDSGPYLNLGRTPPSYSSYERFYLNWLTPNELKVSGNYNLETITASNKAYLISQYGNSNLNGENPVPVEFFLLENRQQSGWDSYLPGHGMLITHIYYNPTTWANNTPNNIATAMGVDIVEADKIASDATLAGDPFPGTSNVTSYYPTLRNGTNIKKPLLNIQEINGVIQFHFGTNIVLTQNLKPFSTVQGTPSAVQTVTVNGQKLKDVVTISFKVGQHFEMKKETDPETSWGKTLTLIPVDSVVSNTNIQLRYNPTVPSYTDVHNDTFVITSGTSDYVDAQLSGTSTRAIYVIPPVANPATDTSFTDFVASWNNVYDAVGYYLTVYNISDGTSSITEGFDNGLLAPVGWTITASATSISTNYSGTNSPSLQFQNTGEYVQTDKYLLPVTNLSFYIHSMGAYNGGFLIEAQNDQNTWQKVDSIPVTTSLYEKNKTYSFPETKNYTQFRFKYFKGTGSITFDDVTVGFAKQLNYNLHESWITTNTDTLTNLMPNTEYFYKVRASDKSIYYENITNFSNLISVTTIAYPYAKKLVTTVNSSGEIIVYLPTVNTVLMVYNLLGQNIKTIVPESTTLKITDLPRHQIYILKANNLITKIVN